MLTLHVDKTRSALQVANVHYVDALEDLLEIQIAGKFENISNLYIYIYIYILLWILRYPGR